MNLSPPEDYQSPTADQNPSFTLSQRQLFESVRGAFSEAVYVPTLVDESIFTVRIDDSEELKNLVARAHDLKDLPFEEKFTLVNKLAVDALPVNAVEMASKGDEVSKSLVYSKHPLSDALKSQSGCCRYQGALFFTLAREASLGKAHFMFTQRMGPRSLTVYNVLFDDNGQRLLVSIYNQTLSPESRDKFGYPEPEGAQPGDFAKGQNYYAYFALPDGDPLTIKTQIQAQQDQENWGALLM